MPRFESDSVKRIYGKTSVKNGYFNYLPPDFIPDVLAIVCEHDLLTFSILNKECASIAEEFIHELLQKVWTERPFLRGGERNSTLSWKRSYFTCAGAFRRWDNKANLLGHKKLAGHSSPITCLAGDTQRQLLLSAAVDGSIVVWDLTNAKALETLSAGGRVTSLHVGELYVVAAVTINEKQAFARAWRIDQRVARSFSFVPVAQNISHDNQEINSIQLMGNTLTTSSRYSIKFWSLTNQECTQSLTHDTGIRCMTHDGTRLACGVYDGLVSFLDLADTAAPLAVFDDPDARRKLLFLRLYRGCYVTGTHASIVARDASTGKLVRIYEVLGAAGTPTAPPNVSPAVTRASTPTPSRASTPIAGVSTATSATATTTAAASAATATATAATSTTAAVSSSLLAAPAPSIAVSTAAAAAAAAAAAVNHVYLNFDKIVVCSQDKTIKMYSFSSGQRLWTITAAQSPASACWFSDTYLAAAFDDGTLQLFSNRSLAGPPPSTSAGCVLQ